MVVTRRTREAGNQCVGGVSRRRRRRHSPLPHRSSLPLSLFRSLSLTEANKTHRSVRLPGPRAQVIGDRASAARRGASSARHVVLEFFFFFPRGGGGQIIESRARKVRESERLSLSLSLLHFPLAARRKKEESQIPLSLSSSSPAPPSSRHSFRVLSPVAGCAVPPSPRRPRRPACAER